MIEKRVLRTSFISARDSLPVSFRNKSSLTISKRVLSLPEIRASSLISVYVNIGSEVATGYLIEKLILNGKKIAVPYIEKETGLMHMSVISAVKELKPGAFGIPEPDKKSRKCLPPDSIDSFIIPGCAFDAAGFRLGYGRGFYDSYLSGVPAGKAVIALAFSTQITGALPRDAHDVPVNIIATEKALVRI